MILVILFALITGATTIALEHQDSVKKPDTSQEAKK